MSLHCPLTTIITREPLGIAAFNKSALCGVPFEAGVIPVGHVHEMAGDDSGRTDRNIANWALACLDAIQPIIMMVFARVELYLSVLQELTLTEYDFAVERFPCPSPCP